MAARRLIRKFLTPGRGSLAFGSHVDYCAGMEISQKLKVWRKARKLTQRGAAVELQVPLETLRRWEQGKNEPVGLARIALLSVIDKKKKTQ